MRIRPMSAEDGDAVPKPMVRIGGMRPMIWHVMKYYAHFGHTDFVLCLGYRGDLIKDYFLNYNEYLTNDFVLHGHGDRELMSTDIHDWRITFVDTGLYSNIGERLRRVRPHVENEEMFLANYSDGLSDLPLNDYIAQFKASGKTAGFVSVRPPQTSHVVDVEPDGNVAAIRHIRDGVWINGGYFVLRPEIFDQMNPGEELVHEPFQRLIDARRLYAHQYKGFWKCIDTFKEKQELDELYVSGHAPWQLWKPMEP
jgi:glucose-1-phosphate cytidylyltransferase